ncbi:hypothetical protein [Arthrobacter sp. JUb115]|nr:hypothetical protein [Arthrobacter sp. JUb115]
MTSFQASDHTWYRQRFKSHHPATRSAGWPVASRALGGLNHWFLVLD